MFLAHFYSISGLPIHLWPEETFSRVAKKWGDLVNIDIKTLSPSSFERAHIQIETDWTFHIDEIIDVRVDDVIFQVRITEIEEAIGPKCDYCCEVIVDSDSGKPDNSNTKVESLDNDSFNRQHIHSTGTFVPNSVKSASVKNDLLEVNKRDDLRAMTSMSDMLEENIGLVNRDEVYHCSFSDFAEAYGLRVGGNDLDLGPIVHEGVVESKGVVSPITSGPICDLPRVNAAETIELNGRQRKIRLVSDVLMNNTTLFDKVAQRIGEVKRGRGRLKKKNLTEKEIVYGSLFDSDFHHRKKLLVLEAEATVKLGKFIGMETKGNEEGVIRDIARIINAHDRA
ncbi:hypothetical protein V6N13_069437 [Hibiscus sabdariffa]